MISAGISVVVAAGNQGQDACNYSPGRVPEAMTVGATEKTDRRWGPSNYGECVSWFAPGCQIVSAGIGDDRQTVPMSGTSMATPHTVGVAALLLEHYPRAEPAEIKRLITQGLSLGVVSDARGSRNHLLYSLEPTDLSSGRERAWN